MEDLDRRPMWAARVFDGHLVMIAVAVRQPRSVRTRSWLVDIHRLGSNPAFAIEQVLTAAQRDLEQELAKEEEWRENSGLR